MSQTTQHTPGPWFAMEDAGFNGSMWDITAENGTAAICHLYGIRDVAKGQYDHETAATARLIAAAPDLLEALMVAVNELRRYVNYTTPEGEESVAWAGYSSSPAMMKISAAIAKATQP